MTANRLVCLAGVFSALLVLSTSTQVHAQATVDDTYQLSIEDGIGGPAGSEQTIKIFLDMATPTDSLAGWSIGVCHDETALNPTGASDGATTLTINGGNPADFDQVNVIPNGDPGIGAMQTAGVNQAVVISFLGGSTLPAGVGYHLLNVTYELSGPDFFAPVDFCNTTPGGAFSVDTVVSLAGGTSAEPLQSGATIEVGAIFPPSFSLATDLTVEGGVTTTAAVTLETSEFTVFGFSFGVSHDAAVVTLGNISPGADLVNADFFHADSSPTNGDGGIVAAILSTSAPLESLDPLGTYEIALFEYDAASGAATDDVSALTFTGTLQPEPTSPPTELLISLGQEGIGPTTNDGSITVTSTVGGVVFVRGDANGDGSINVADPVFNLEFQFLGGPALCMLAMDDNDDGVVNVADPAYNLAFQFSGGPAIPAPSPACGADPTPDTLTCDTPSSACP